MKAATVRLVRERAGGRCEYCRIREQDFGHLSHQIDHVRSGQAGGSDDPSNLALACQHCNAHKGPNVGGVSETSGRVIRLFHPRRDRWATHFRFDGPTLVGRTVRGRATVQMLDLNAPRLVRIRRALIAEGESL